MKTRITFAFVLFLLLAAVCHGQIALTQTTLAAAVSATAQTITVASATGITTAGALYIIDSGQAKGELVYPRIISGTQITISRTGPSQAAHISGARVLIAPTPPAFQSYNPNGACVVANGANGYSPWVNTITGEQWICSTVTLQWVAGYNNPTSNFGVTTALASGAGANVPTGRLFHVTGANAVTSWTNASMIGFAGGNFCTIPDGAYTYTAAGNIVSTGTAVVGKLLCFQWDSGAAKWYPSY